MRLHPQPETRPITFREATRGIPEDAQPRLPASFVRKYAPLHKGGWSTDLKLWKKISGSFANGPSLKWATWNSPLGTIIKKEIALTGIIHPSRKRYLSVDEIKACSTFPPDFKFKSRKEAYARIGNSVPPKLMEGIAKHIHTEVLNGRHAPTVISTFAGGGGSSLGYKNAGFNELLAVEWDDDAVQTLKDNFLDLQIFHGDIAKLSVKKCLELAKVKEGELDVLDGSPPCQGFSVHGKRNFTDPRNSLFGEFVRLLQGIKPKVFVMENVKGMIKGPMKQIFLKILEALREAGYHVEAQVMNAKFYGVPQSRERVIFIGIRTDLYKSE
tara:strand:+ start:247 stop:1227 length:981 start_codon:yes stop_codon:yes gene_type:complete